MQRIGQASLCGSHRGDRAPIVIRWHERHQCSSANHRLARQSGELSQRIDDCVPLRPITKPRSSRCDKYLHHRSIMWPVCTFTPAISNGPTEVCASRCFRFAHRVGAHLPCRPCRHDWHARRQEGRGGALSPVRGGACFGISTVCSLKNNTTNLILVDPILRPHDVSVAFSAVEIEPEFADAYFELGAVLMESERAQLSVQQHTLCT